MLTLEGVTHVYPNGTRALDNASLTIPKGMFGLLGPNGAGKSTLMRCIATLQTPSQGTIRFGDIDAIREPERLRATLGYLPQDFGVYPRVSAWDLLDHLAVLKGIATKGERKQTVETLLQQVNLWDVRKKAVAGFSGGMRQRFGIAQALIGNPKLVIVDEPTAGLDPEERVRFHNLLADIASDVVVILSTHIVSDVEDLCAQFAVINKGQVLLTGRPGDYVGSLAGRIWSRAIDKSEADAVKQRARVVSTRLAAGRTVVRAYGESPPGPGFDAVAPDLEDVYFCMIAGYLAPQAAAAA